jgi:hypothetical protein
VIPVTNFVFNAAWQKMRLSDGTLGRHGRPDWSVIKSTDPKDLFEGWTDGRGRTKYVSDVGINYALELLLASGTSERLSLVFESVFPGRRPPS